MRNSQSPHRSPETPIPECVVLLLHAFARSEASGGSVAWEELNEAFQKAVAAYPERYADIQAVYAEDEEAVETA